MERKLPRHYEHPVDNYIYDIASIHSRQIEFLTPNQITTLSLLFAIGSIYAFIKQYYFLSASLFVVSYFYDCVDGLHARRLNMMSQFGATYDHIKDYVVLFTLFILILYKMRMPYKVIFVFITIALMIIEQYHATLQDVYYGKDYKSGIYLFPHANNTQHMVITRYFGAFTFIAFYILCILFIGISSR